jgi:hypothetical protein
VIAGGNPEVWGVRSLNLRKPVVLPFRNLRELYTYPRS